MLSKTKTKIKRCFSIDAKIFDALLVLSKGEKGGASGWVQSACEAKLESINREKDRKKKILADRKQRASA